MGLTYFSWPEFINPELKIIDFEFGNHETRIWKSYFFETGSHDFEIEHQDLPKTMV